ncbi:hypothetical protein R5R35_005803 [Gryllus longicercus]|uniref:C-type lectin domain-containing protein n=1 Tax=Gryllus longicercus TaxID=2509291 RepID=A0AAN9Z9V8_9ORTH
MPWLEAEFLGVVLLMVYGSCGAGIIETDVPPGYARLASGGSYKVGRAALAWEEARAACELEGAHLLVVDSREEAAALRRWLRGEELATDAQRTYALHAGFHVPFVTVLGQPISNVVRERWRHDEPSSQICGMIDEEVWMLYGVCSKWERYVCEFPAIPTLPSPRPAAQPTLPPCAHALTQGYERAPGWLRSAYKLHAPATWERANATCASEGAHLAVVETAAEAEALVDFLHGRELSSFEKLVWVGARTAAPATVLGEPLNATAYNRWLRERQHDWECLAIDRRLLFLSRQCSNDSDRYNFLCEKDI